MSALAQAFFTVKLYNRVRQTSPEICFYAIDATPAMLISLVKKSTEITPFVGIAENIKGSIKEARKHFNIPLRFDAVFSTLMLHHSTEPRKVFKSIKETLKRGGKAIVIDPCKHNFKEFKTELGNIHLGFDMESINKMAREHFSKIKIEKIGSICCECSGHSAEIFTAFFRILIGNFIEKLKNTRAKVLVIFCQCLLTGK